MHEVRTIGAGGRATVSHPIIADVWAAAEETQEMGELAEGQRLSGRASFTLAYSRPYLAARQVEWQGRRYRITGVKATGVSARTLTLAAREIV